MRKKIVDPRFAKSKEYGRVIRRIESERMCPFCPENFKYHKNPILKRRGTWFITQSSWPYKNTKFHFIILNKKHKERLGELKVEDWASVASLANWAIKNYKIKGGGVALRFGDTKYTGATVCHLHAHLIVPKTKKGKSVPVFFPFG